MGSLSWELFINGTMSKNMKKQGIHKGKVDTMKARDINTNAYLQAIEDPFSAEGIRFPDWTLIPTGTLESRVRVTVPVITLGDGSKVFGLQFNPYSYVSYYYASGGANSSAVTWTSGGTSAANNVLIAGAVQYRCVAGGFRLYYGGLPQSRYMRVFSGRPYGPITNANVADFLSAAAWPSIQMFLTPEATSSEHIWMPVLSTGLTYSSAPYNTVMNGLQWKDPNIIYPAANSSDFTPVCFGLLGSTSADEVTAEIVHHFEFIPLNSTLSVVPIGIIAGDRQLLQDKIQDQINKGKTEFSGTKVDSSGQPDWVSATVNGIKEHVSNAKHITQVLMQGAQFLMQAHDDLVRSTLNVTYDDLKLHRDTGGNNKVVKAALLKLSAQPEITEEKESPRSVISIASSVKRR